MAALLALLLSNYMRLSWKASKYEQLRADFDGLRKRYRELQKISSQRRDQIASLETLASEISSAYGIKQPPAAELAASMDSDNSAAPTVEGSIEEFNFLKAASYSRIYQRYAFQWQSHTQPTAWPVDGVVRSSFGGRTDPFSGEGAFHTGIDLSASTGSEVHATGDGVVANAGWSGRYGKLVVVDHGNGIETYYAHLSQFLVVPGEEVRVGEVIALSGGTGRVTSPHLHYEIRVAGTPVNPYRFLKNAYVARPARPVANSDLGL
ncbi:MAG: M23 family metallopeptidase [Acidobacteriaceae bacterium]|nr:M23 family metallopeptidase [Acidobacteriaceae bacterium]